MSRRADFGTALVIGAGGAEMGGGNWVGPVCRALQAEGFRVVLAESDPELIPGCREVADEWYAGALDAPAVRAITDRVRPRLVMAVNGLHRGLGPTGVPVAPAWDGELVLCYESGDVLVAGTAEYLGPERLLAAPAPSLDERGLERLKSLGATALREAGVPPGGYAIGFDRDPAGAPVFRGIARLNPRSAELAAVAAGFPLVEVVTGLVLGHRLSDLRERLSPPVDSPARTLVRLGEVIAAGHDLESARRRVVRGRTAAHERAGELTAEVLREAKKSGMSDDEVAHRHGLRAETVRELRHAWGNRPGFPALGGGLRHLCYGDGSTPDPRVKAALLVVGAQPSAIPRLPDLETVAIGSSPGLLQASAADRRYLVSDAVEDVLAVVRAEAAAGPLAGVLLRSSAEKAWETTVALREAGFEVLGAPRVPPLEQAGHAPLGAVEVEVDALYDGTEVFVGAVTEYLDKAAARRGPRSLGFPALTLSGDDLRRVREAVTDLARRLDVRGLVHARFALVVEGVRTLAVETGASHTLAFAASCTGLPLAEAAARTALGEKIAQLRAEAWLPETGDAPASGPVAVLRPDAHSGRRVVGVSAHFGGAFAEAMAAARSPLPATGRVLVSQVDGDRRELALPLHVLAETGFAVLATELPAAILRRHGLAVREVPDSAVTGLLTRGLVHLLADVRAESRDTAAEHGIPCVTTICELIAAVRAVQAQNARGAVRPITEFPATGRSPCADGAPRRPQRVIADATRR
ncbi:hypothetical protein L3Q67_32545 [Saccharothrix sp. AJ9571]|nr:hypothetical protein L3Q67_32545 [Saccharothrix sp. AJ9571]